MTYHPLAGATQSTTTVTTGTVYSGTTIVTLFSDQKTGAAAGVGTLLNAPNSLNPGYWWPINVSGTTRFIPCW